MKLIRPRIFNAGDREVIGREETVADVQFNIHKFNNRPKPTDSREVLIICCFSEFGCEVVGAMYCLPRIMRENAGKYVIVAGWHGRSYLYKHLADEFWEIKEEYQWLREYCRAFHHESINLKRVEKNFAEYGKVLKSDYPGKMAVGIKCRDCGAFWGDLGQVKTCVKCNSENIIRSILGDVGYWKPKAVKIPQPSREKLELAESYLKPNSVGVFARGRKCYGRNLHPDFYVKLISKLEDMGYNPIWMGEKQSTQPCPVSHITDYSRMEQSSDLELTLAIVSKLKFTIQFWTASTRVAALVNTPFLLFESPDQIFGAGQEGYRLQLITFGKRKMVFSDFQNTYDNHEGTLKVTEMAVKEMESDNWDDMIGLVEDEDAVAAMMRDGAARVGWHITT